MPCDVEVHSVRVRQVVDRGEISAGLHVCANCHPSAATLSSFQHEQRVARGRPLQNALCAYITIQGWAARAAGLFAASRSASSHSKNSDARLRFVFGFQTPAGHRVREMVVGAECKRRLSSGVRTVSGAHPLLRVHLRAVPDLRVDGDEVNQLSPRRNRRPVSDKHASNTRPVGMTHPGIPRIPQIVTRREGTGGFGSGVGSCVVETGKSARVVHAVAASALVVADCPHVCSRGPSIRLCLRGGGQWGAHRGPWRRRARWRS